MIRQGPPDLISQSIATDSTEKERLVILELKFRPIIRELVITPEALPLQLVVLDSVLGPANRLHRQEHRVKVPWACAFGFDVQISYFTGERG